MLYDQFSDELKLFMEWYPKTNDFLVGEEEIRNPTSIDLERIFSIYIDDDGVLSFANACPVTKEIAAQLQPFVRNSIDLDQYDYFVIAYRPMSLT